MKNITIDFHTHLLPDVDCSGDPKLAAAFINIMKRSGIRHIVLTPHFYPQLHSSINDFIKSRNLKIAALQNELAKSDINEIELIPAAEILLCPNIHELDGLEKLCINNTKSILFEMPDLPWGESLIETLESVRKIGLDVIIAHADRYGVKESQIFIDMGFKIQLNAEGLCSVFKKSKFIDWAKNGYVYALGSDKHIHSKNPPSDYRNFIKAADSLSSFSHIIEERMLELIGK